ncbi:NACHT domain-containing protein [Casimicrobium huifangae]|uniref:NACHT domain-containing protein n=1 Tax=Casimicrobium huifangae TaxID=2591109 RepID=UPI0037846FE7
MSRQKSLLTETKHNPERIGDTEASGVTQIKSSRNKGKNRKTAGGAATGGGMNFQAAVTAIACIYMARGQRLAWLANLVDDTPVAVEAETGGAGDDIKLHLKTGEVVEVQVKKGLQSGDKLWASLIGLARAADEGTINFGVLVVSTTSSRTITENLANDIARLGDGRNDNLSPAAITLVEKLEANGLPVADSCKRIRIQTVAARESEQASVAAACAELVHLCSDDKVHLAWTVLYKDSTELIENRGRRDPSSVLRVLRTAGIGLRTNSSTAPVVLLERLTEWTLKTHEWFSVFGVRNQLSTDNAWIPLSAIVRNDDGIQLLNSAEALRNYQAWEKRPIPHGASVIDPETLGRFITRAVLVGGPGMGKSTLLKRVARRYSEDRIPVLHVQLRTLAARMKAGSTFEEALFELGLDGSDVTSLAARHASFPNWLLLCDGLDECGKLQESVAAGVASFVAGHPGCRILVTTRPVGYETAHFHDWRHYDLVPLETSEARKHLATLVRECAPPDSPLQTTASVVCASELEHGNLSKVVARSPLLLGLAASIIVRAGHLGKSKARLFEQIFELIDAIPNSRTPEPPFSKPTLQRFLDAMGWNITEQPLRNVKETLTLCADVFVQEMGSTKLQSQGIAETCLNYWVTVGMIERIGNGLDDFLVFIHKSFGEFAAARHLRHMSEEAQSASIKGVANSPEWVEVVRFAGLLGLANVVAQVWLVTLVDELNSKKPITQLLELLAEATPPPDIQIRQRIIGEAFKVVASEQRQRAFEVGELLVTAARRFPNEIGPQAHMLLNHEQPWTWLVAWATACAAGSAFYDPSSLEDTLCRSVAMVGPRISSSLSGGIVIGSGPDENLVQSLVLDAANELLHSGSSESIDAFVLKIFNHPHLGTTTFLKKAREVSRAKGKKFEIGRPETTDWASVMAPFAGYDEASAIAYETIFDALDIGLSAVDDDANDPVVLLHFSAFLEASQFNHVDSSDIWAWTKPFDKVATRETLRGFIGVSGLDLDGLRQDARRAKKYMHSSGPSDVRSLYSVTAKVDPPAVDWDSASSHHLDPTLIEAALSHPSRWIVWLAANLIDKLLPTSDLVPLIRRLFTHGSGHTLWAASALAADLDKQQTIALLIERLSSPHVSGCENLVRLLASFAIPWNDGISDVVRVGLKGPAESAVEVAKLAVSVAQSGQNDLLLLLEDALKYWAAHEEPYPEKGGAIPESPRAELIRARAKISVPAYLELRAWLVDSRSDVRKASEESFLDWLRNGVGSRAQFLHGISTGELPPHLLGSALAQLSPLQSNEISQLASLMESEDPGLRFNSMSLLHTDYLNANQIRDRAHFMTQDQERQISERAYRILDTL